MRSLSGAGNFPELVEYLQKSGGDALTRNNTGNILSTVLETLDIQQHSLGVLAVSLIVSLIIHWCYNDNYMTCKSYNFHILD